ncbi:ribose-5-phosphate isomerase, partial [Vibrio parahaemolyticus]|nr:ribose-5-phosphate isomerase [Vibrio parahaemolyticus]
GRVLGVDLAKEILNAYLSANFEGGRHLRRIEKISAIEQSML